MALHILQVKILFPRNRPSRAPSATLPGTSFWNPWHRALPGSTAEFPWSTAAAIANRSTHTTSQCKISPNFSTQNQHPAASFISVAPISIVGNPWRNAEPSFRTESPDKGSRLTWSVTLSRQWHASYSAAIPASKVASSPTSRTKASTEPLKLAGMPTSSCPGP